MANSIDTDVIQDGQLVRSVIVQEGTVLKSGGQIDTKSLIQTADGAQLCDNVYIVGGGGSSLPSQTGHSGEFLTTNGTEASWAAVDALPSQSGQSGKFLTTNGTTASWAEIPTGGSVPTLTWFKNNTGTTLDTGLDLSNAKLVNVYKNGILLEKNSAASYDREYTATTSGSQQLKIYPTGSSPISFQNYSSWELDFEFKWGSGSGIAGLVGAQNTNEHYPFMLAVYGGVLSVWLNNGSGWFLEHGSLGWTPVVGSTYDYKIKFTGTAYEFYHKLSSDISYTTDFIFNSSTRLENGPDGIWFFNVNLGFDLYSQSTLYMNDVKFIADNNTLFDGSVAVKGTDFVVDPAWAQQEQVISGDADYSISSSAISFATTLESTDKIAVEVF